MAGRRRRSLSPEERALWRRVAAETRPLRSAHAPPEAPPPPAKSSVSEAPPAAIPPPRLPAPARLPPPAPERGHPAIDRRRSEKLRRGRLEPEARLDLHGMSSARAHAELTAFVLASHAAGRRLLLVITGKGRLAEDDRLAPQRGGILRHSLPHWLSAPPLGAHVLHSEPAHRRHGGAGAFYVYLRRRRP